MRLILWVFFLTALVLGTWLVWGEGLDKQFTLAGSIQWLTAAGPWAWAAGIFLLVCDLILPVPSTVVISALGYLYGIWVGGLVAGVGLWLAGVAGYGLGRLFGERFVERWLGAGEYEKGKQLFSNRGGWIVALSRTLPILPEVISCTAGLVRMPFRSFAVATACGSFPMGFLFAAIGKAGHDSPTWAFVLSFVVPCGLWWLAKRIQRDIRP
jgi:uncharacterized membrane protein YdjX (TVP38/TMEM64 family)